MKGKNSKHLYFKMSQHSERPSSSKLFKKLIPLSFLISFIVLIVILKPFNTKTDILIKPVLSQNLTQQFNPYTSEVANDDPRLLQYLLSNHLQPPSTDFYTLHNMGDTHSTIDFSLREYVTDKLLPIKNGFFIEAGANDGEFMTNTLNLERKLNWSGLLIEPNPYLFKKLISKNRKAWTANVCLSKKPELMDFLILSGGKDKPMGMGKLSPRNYNETTKDFDPSEYISIGSVGCFPLESILRAINISTVDFFSLDVEGFEYKVLSSIPFHKIQFNMILMEHYWMPERKRDLIRLMKTAGFKLKKKSKIDFLFVHNSFI